MTGFDPADVADRDALRDELGYGADETVCIVTVGGSGVGGDLLRRVIDAPPRPSPCPDCGRSSSPGPASTRPRCPRVAGVEVRRYVHGLYRHLAACDLAVVQGGLTTCMELTATGRPFLYFPLGDHFEQTFHVPTASTATAPANAWMTPLAPPRSSPLPSARRSQGGRLPPDRPRSSQPGSRPYRRAGSEDRQA